MGGLRKGFLGLCVRTGHALCCFVLHGLAQFEAKDTLEISRRTPMHVAQRRAVLQHP